MKKSSKSSLKKKRSHDTSLQHKNEASYKLKKKKLLHLAEKRSGAERVKKKHFQIAYHQNVHLLLPFSLTLRIR